VTDTIETTQTLENLMLSARFKPRILVCAPSNAAVDYVILKTMKERFIDGNGGKYNPSILRVGSGHSTSVSIVSLQNKVDSTLKECSNAGDLKISMDECQTELSRIDKEVRHLQRRIRALIASCPHKLAKGASETNHHFIYR
jgi:senataxin